MVKESNHANRLSPASHWKMEWRQFVGQEPGRRFRDRHDRRRKNRRSRRWWSRLLNLVGGGLCLAVGVVLTVAPGPALVFFFFGGVLIANESRTTARGLDWIDVRIAPLRRRIHRQWRRLSPRMRRVTFAGMMAGGIACFVAGLCFLR